MGDNAELESIYAKMSMRAHRGMRVQSLSAPALSTQFVKSSYTQRASATADGAFAQIVFPSRNDIDKRLEHRFGEKSRNLFMYDSTRAAAAFPVGYGERSALAVAKETAVYQLRGVFPAAVQKLALLRARVSARSGSVESLNRLFAAMWGLSYEDVEQLPSKHLTGSEATRLAAMEDRAYHSLSGHPAFTGGFRIDMATITSDQLGPNVPLNWQRLRTGLKMVAAIQSGADLKTIMFRQMLADSDDFSLFMDMSVGSQPLYYRSDPWELILDKLLGVPEQHTAVPFMMTMAQAQKHIRMVDLAPSPEFQKRIQSVALIVSGVSSKALEETLAAIRMYDHDRALIADSDEVEHDELATAELGRSFHVDKHVVKRDSLRFGLKRQYIGEDKLPDIVSHGKGLLQLDLGELREAGLLRDISVGGALNLAVYVTVNQKFSAITSAKLLRLVKDPLPESRGSVASRLRRQDLYADEKVRKLGARLFGAVFTNALESIIANLISRRHFTHESLTLGMWRYLTERCKKSRPCPQFVDWRELISYVMHEPEGWTLFYWARIGIGKLHYAMEHSILAPMAAGEEVEFLEMMRRGAKVRAAKWAAFYGDQTDAISEQLKDTNDRMKKVSSDEWNSATKRFIPPGHRDRLYYEEHFDQERILNRLGGLKHSEYQRMVECQVKSKVFSSLEFTTKGRELAVGLSDAKLRDLLITFYQTRWLSLEVRINHARDNGTVFQLGNWKLYEHPWGDLATTFPDTAAGMMEYSVSLDSRAWTVAPDYLWDKVKKSIMELWGDLANEIQTASAFIDEKVECLPDADTATKVGAMVNEELQGTDQAILLPAPGYRPPYRMPDKMVELESGPQLYAAGTYIEPAVEEFCEEEFDINNLNCDDDIFVSETTRDYQQEQLVCTVIDRYLTYREIWNELDVPQAEDNEIRCALSLRESMSVDDPHMDASYGPLVLESERDRTRRMWSSKMPFIKRRLGFAVVAIVEDDM